MSEKNDWRIVYKTIYYDFEWKMSKKNDSGIVYNSIYYHLQSKIDWKMSEKLTQKMK